MEETLKSQSEALEELAVQLVKQFTELSEDQTIEPSTPAPLPRIQLIFAFNGVGKTLLSEAFKKAVTHEEGIGKETEEYQTKVIYYNAFTEDLFHWDNDLERDTYRKLLIQDNNFIKTCVVDQGNEKDIIRYFHRYIEKPIDAQFGFNNEGGASISFTLATGNEGSSKAIKISKGEESCFVWSIFYTILNGIIADIKEEGGAYPHPEYIFIDDPVSSLDENHLVQLAVDLAELIKHKDTPPEMKFIITTHNPLFYNTIYNSLCSGFEKGIFLSSILRKTTDGTYELQKQKDDTPFPYHRYLLSEIERALKANTIHKFHFFYLRYILEKTAIFLGIKKWSELLPEEVETQNLHRYLTRFINTSTHGQFGDEGPGNVSDNHIIELSKIISHLRKTYHIKGN